MSSMNLQQIVKKLQEQANDLVRKNGDLERRVALLESAQRHVQCCSSGGPVPSLGLDLTAKPDAEFSLPEKGALGELEKKGKSAKEHARTEPKSEEEEEDPIIRCVCGEYGEEEEGRTMICCDGCEAWQHNDCMGLPDDYSLPKYLCERCKPSHHHELLAAVKRGEKPWANAARRRLPLEIEKVKRKDKGFGA